MFAAQNGNKSFHQKFKSVLNFTFKDTLIMEKILLIDIIIVNCGEHRRYPEQPLILPDNENES